MARRRWMAWAALGAAFLAFELAVDLAIALPAQCLLFGCNDAAAAWWCLRRDPIRSRGWLAAGLYAASALLKVGVGAFGSFVMTAAVAGVAEGRDRSATGPPRGEPPAYFMAAAFVALGTLLAAWGVANLTCGAALWSGRKLWLGPEASLARAQGVWPPWAAAGAGLDRAGPTNRVNLVVWLAFIPWMMAQILILIVGLAVLSKILAGDGVAAVVALVTMVVSMVAVPVYNLRRLDGRLAAESPLEAWELEAP